MLTSAKKRMTKLSAGIALGILAMALSGCGSTKWGFPYRADVQQGNWVTADQVARLEKGMSREQVRFVLGTPTLQDAFHANRWDYPYYSKPGYGPQEERRLTVWFDGDVLTRWEGDAQPDRQPFEKADTGAQATSNEDRPLTSTESHAQPSEAAPAEHVEVNPVPAPVTGADAVTATEPLR